MKSNILEIRNILFGQWLIQSILGFKSCLSGRRDSFLTHEGTAGYGTHDEECQGDNYPNGKDGQNYSLQYVREIFFTHIHITFFRYELRQIKMLQTSGCLISGKKY